MRTDAELALAEEIGAALRLIRRTAKMSAEQVAEKFKISPDTLRKYEIGRISIKLAFLKKFVKLFGITIDHILNERVFTEEDVARIKATKWM